MIWGLGALGGAGRVSLGLKKALTQGQPAIHITGDKGNNLKKMKGRNH